MIFNKVTNIGKRNCSVNQKTVGMLSSYPGLQNKRDWLWKQTPQPFGIWGGHSNVSQRC